ncbi:MAG: GatB/YqeY domain-containing protein [Dehalococcoidia bacterium]|nr:GatB/YqeY domain-containing protein [Dehalococcoidia bacterium]
MTSKAELAEDLKAAMRAGDTLRRDVLRLVLTAVSNAEIARVDITDESATRGDLADEEVAAVLQKQAKQRRDSIDEYARAGRQDLVDRERGELRIIEGYLPAQLGRDEIAAAVRAVIAETGASGPKDKSRVMPAALQRLKGRAGGRAINEVVTELLG